ncbi:MAG: class B sortase [Firmicutes bacterium]|nr:class B sortase [Bacillota bacterium]
MNRRRTTAFAALLLSMALMAFAGQRWLKAERIYKAGDAAYRDIGACVKQSPAADPQPKEPQAFIPPLEIDFEALKAINKDAAAWLYCPGTVIDYPVIMADDYSYYLTHLPDGTKNANGSLFIDYNCAPDFSGQLTVLYGHHMRSGKMFGSLKGYKTQHYYDGHPYMYLYTPQGNYRAALLHGCVIDAGVWRERGFMYEQNLGALLSYAAHSSTFKSSAVYEEGNRVIALSTCSYEFDGARYVVIGILSSQQPPNTCMKK